MPYIMPPKAMAMPRPIPPEARIPSYSRKVIPSSTTYSLRKFYQINLKPELISDQSGDPSSESL
jgi:hypothetical protein